MMLAIFEMLSCILLEKYRLPVAIITSNRNTPPSLILTDKWRGNAMDFGGVVMVSLVIRFR